MKTIYELSLKLDGIDKNIFFGIPYSKDELKKMLESGNIRTGVEQEGMYGSRGASFTDGDFPETATFQTLYEDQNTHSADKKFSSQNYGDKAENFVRYFWDNKQEETKQYLSKISGGKKVETFEDALKIAEGFKYKAKPKELENDPEALSKLYGVTIVFEKDKLPDLTKEVLNSNNLSDRILEGVKGGLDAWKLPSNFTIDYGSISQKLVELGADLTKLGIR